MRPCRRKSACVRSMPRYRFRTLRSSIKAGKLTVGSSDIASCFSGRVNCGSYIDPLISSAFGFCLRVNDQTFFTVDQLNAGGATQALTYQNGTSTNWAIAFEDTLGGDRDFNDMVVKVESIN